MSQDVARQVGANGAFNTAGDAIAQGSTVQQIQTQYATAVSVQKPRDLIEVEKRCLVEAALAGDVCFYGWGSGKNRVEGPSIDCAMIAGRNFGNCAVEMRPVIDMPSSYIMEAAFIDLETGFTYSRQFRQSKNWTVAGRMDEDRKDDMRFQIGQSKAQRNCILKALPKWLLDKMVDVAKVGVREKLESYIKQEGIESARKLSLDALTKMGAKLENIEEKYGKVYAAWDVELLVTLKGDIRALSDGVESADALFPAKGATEPDKKKAGGKLSEKDMKKGDPDTHQGHEPEKKPDKKKAGKKKADPEEEERIELVDKIGNMEGTREFGDVKVPDFRMEHLGVMDLDKATLDQLTNYSVALAGLDSKNKTDDKAGF